VDQVVTTEVWRQRARLSLPTLQPNPRTRLAVDQYLRRLPDAVVGKRYGDTLFHPSPGWWRYTFSPYLTAIADLNLKPTRVLDVGCGDGLVTNFYATIYPDADVVGLDTCGLCLITTRTIAARLGLKNLLIVQGDFVDGPSIFHGQTFDLVLARAFTSFGMRCSCSRGLRPPTHESNLSMKASRILAAIRQVLTSLAGLFISTEYWAGAAQLWCWGAQLGSARFSVDWTGSQGVRTAGRRWTMLVARATPTATQISLGNVLALLVDAEAQEIGRAPPLTGYVAEALFNTVATDGLLFGFQATRNETILRRELYSAGTIVVSYDYTNGTEREVRFWPRGVATHLRAQLGKESDHLKTQGWDVLRFVPRDQIGNTGGENTE
jgi:SAM-dependent methyltransferase